MFAGLWKGKEQFFFRKSITWPKLLNGNERLSIKELYWAAETTKDRTDANDSYESSEKHSLQRYVLLLCYHYGFHGCSFCNKNCDSHTLAKSDSWLYISQSQLRPAPASGWLPGIGIFYALDSNFLGVGTLELTNPPGWGRKKRANAPSSVNTATFFIDRTVE